MKICGFSIARNALRFGYPLRASLRSMLPLVDELVLNVGDSDDGTWELVQSMSEPKIKAFHSTWDMTERRGGKLLAEQTNLALERCQGDWGLYLQADEVLHEKDYPVIRQALENHLNRATEALTFRYLHFYGSFQTVQDNPRWWYPRASRVVKLGIGAVSWGDAMDFGLCRGGKQRHLKRADSGAWVYHYGWVRPPQVMLAKQKNFHRLYHDDAWLEEEYKNKKPEDLYNERGHLRFFRGTHPEVMQEFVARQDWRYDHGIETQWPDWLRHSYVWASHQIWWKSHRLELHLRRLERAVIAPFRRSSQPAESED
jgi:hypothetical protein